MIHCNEGYEYEGRPIPSSFSISSGGTWLPGLFQDERTAKYAFRFSCEQLTALQDTANKTDSNITFGMLQECRALERRAT